MTDLLERFKTATVTHTSVTELRRPAVAGGVRQDGLFEHPLHLGRPARVEFRLDLPAVQAGEALLLAFDVGLSDGIRFDPHVDGVRFMIEADGQKLFDTSWRECRWASQAVDLSAWAGRAVRLALLTDMIGNSSYDWATWGSPRILRFDPGTTQPLSAKGDAVSTATVGAVAVKARSDQALKLRLEPQGGGPPMDIALPAASAERWFVKDFEFAEARDVRVSCDPPSALGALRIGAYAAAPVLRCVSPARAVAERGDEFPLRVEVVNEGRGRLNADEATVSLRVGTQRLPEKPLPALLHGQSERLEWNWEAIARQDDLPLEATLKYRGRETRRTHRFSVVHPEGVETLESTRLKLEFARQGGRYVFARIYGREQGRWTPVGVWSPLFALAGEGMPAPGMNVIHPEQLRRERLPQGGETFEFTGTTVAGAADWTLKLRVELPADQTQARLRYQWQASVPRRIDALAGPNVYVGDGTVGPAKTWGLFPGLEYLFGAERSSNVRDFAPALADRRTPHPHKVTVPLMAVTIGPDSQRPPPKPARLLAPDSLKDQPLLTKNPASSSSFTVALWWDPLQRWDGQHAFPSARFASPNFDEGMDNHRLGLFLPSAPEFVPENGDRATNTYLLPAGKTLTLDASLSVTPGPATAAVGEWLKARGGLPAPNPWPRSFQDELALCRTGFLKTVWDETNQTWSHCIGWKGGHAPGFASLLWLDSKLAEDAAGRQAARAQVDLAVKNMLRNGGPGALTSQHGCHIMQWEFPFLYGHLPEAMAALEPMIRGLIRSQQPDGSWRYHAANAEQADLGQPGDSVLGTCAYRAMTLLRYARLTGDAAALAAGETALRFMEGFRVPRGGQTWECPMYEPDILPAGYAVRAYLDAYLTTGNARWLHNAVYWAETGVPFVYLWTLPDKPMMLGATIPVFGSTFYTHSWLAMPVQWCGLVYAYHVFHLAEELARRPLPTTDSPLPLALNFTPNDWKQIVELITVSGMYQQFPDGDKVGAYPDSISRFEQRNPTFLNPEDILVNVLALRGHSPDVSTARVRTAAGEVVISSGARVKQAQGDAAGVRFRLEFFVGEPSHTLVAGLRPSQVRVQGELLPEAVQPVRREPGWWWDAAAQRAYLTMPHASGEAVVEIMR